MAEPGTERDPLHEQLQALVGTNISSPAQADDPVNLPMIRRWTDAFGDRNPIYAVRLIGMHGHLCNLCNMCRVTEVE